MKNDIFLQSDAKEMATLLSISILVGALGFYIYFNGNLRGRHPYKLYAWQMISCSGHYMQSQCVFFFSFYRFYENFMFFCTWGKTPVLMDASHRYFFYSNLLVFHGYVEQVFLNVYLLINVVLFVDIYLITRCPWKSHASRLPAYKNLIVVATMLWTVFVVMMKRSEFLDFVRGKSVKRRANPDFDNDTNLQEYFDEYNIIYL